jgi:hypothetical protein
VQATDILVVTLDATGGWRAAGRELTESLRRVGVGVAATGTGAVPEVRTFMLTDYVQARAARRAAREAIEREDPAAIIYCSITAALLWPRPGAIWLDSVAAENRPGRHGVWQRRLEPRRLREAPLVLTWSPRALQSLPEFDRASVVVPVPVEPSGPPAADRDIVALTYATNPVKRRLDHVLAAWSRARRDGETLVVAGVESLPAVPGVEVAGRLAPAEFRALLRRTRALIAAPSREDYGVAALEALADGCLLVTTPSPGGYPALDLARQLDPRLVDVDLGRAIRIALDDPLPGYAERAARLLEPFSRRAVDRVLAQDVLPRLLAGFA